MDLYCEDDDDLSSLHIQQHENYKYFFQEKDLVTWHIEPLDL